MYNERSQSCISREPFAVLLRESFAALKDWNRQLAQSVVLILFVDLVEHAKCNFWLTSTREKV